MEDRQLTYAEGLQDRESKKGGDRRLVKTAIAAGHKGKEPLAPWHIIGRSFQAFHQHSLLTSLSALPRMASGKRKPGSD